MISEPELATRGRGTLRNLGMWLLIYGPAVTTILGSTALTVAASILKLSEIQILQAVVVLLALIGTSFLSERVLEARSLKKRLAGIDARLEQVLRYAREIETAGLDALVIRRRDLPPLEERLDGAKRVAISGGSLFRLANEYRNLFETLAAEGCQLRFLLTDSESAAAEYLSSAVVYEANDVESYRAQMKMGISWLTGLAADYSKACQVKLYSKMPPFSIVWVDKGNTASIIQVELYPFKLPARDRPMFLLDKSRDPRLFELFASQFEAMWSSKFTRPPSSLKQKDLSSRR